MRFASYLIDRKKNMNKCKSKLFHMILFCLLNESFGHKKISNRLNTNSDNSIITVSFRKSSC